MARIAVSMNGEQKAYAVTERGLTIGRQLENEIVLNHAIVSRKHARIELRGRQAWLIDLDSRNGVTVNRLRVKEEQLGDGDVIGVGPFELQFEDRAAQSVVLDDQRYFPLASDAQPVAEQELRLAPADLQRFYSIGMRLSQVLEFRELLDRVMEEVMRVVPAQRGFLLLRKGDELVPRVVLPVGTGDIAISGTLVRRALDGGQAMLTRDARLDFAGSDSIISANIRSAICAPLLVQGSPIGLIMLDSPGRERFNERDRDLTVAIANFAAVAIERARLTEELRAQGQLRQNLERFLSPNVAQALARYVAQHGTLWEAQELTVSVLFADVKGFTALAEQLSAREVQDLLNEYLHEMTDVIFRYNGTVDKYIGDGIMAVFGAPRLPDEPPDDEHAARAVAAALEMQAAQRRLVGKWEASRAFAIRIGVNTGTAYTGFFGTRHRLEYTAIGDTVNTASRLEGQAEPGGVLIGEDTARLVVDGFTLQEMGELALKGRQQRVRAFKVLGQR